MVNVARDSANTLVFRRVTLRLRMYPGTGEAGALGRVPYLLRAGIASVAGLTRPDGSITLRVPAGGRASLEVFWGRYEIGLAGPLPPSTGLDGARRRLAMLGYPAGPAGGKPGAADERAVLDFQADQDLDPRGLDNAGGLDEATRQRLEGAAGA